MGEAVLKWSALLGASAWFVVSRRCFGRLGQRVELGNHGARDAEDLAAAPAERNPALESCDTLRAKPLDQSSWQVCRKCGCGHAVQFSEFQRFSKRDLTYMPHGLSNQ
jgi:hypothetical protein